MIVLIWAQDINRGIGKSNTLPWKIKNEMKHFIEVTSKKTVVMGRKTFESIGKPLPNRENIVLTHNLKYTANGVVVWYGNIKNLIKKYKQKDLFIIGGKGVYEAFMPYADILNVSFINSKYDCDTYMNPINEKKFKLVSSDESDSEFSIKIFKRKQCFLRKIFKK